MRYNLNDDEHGSGISANFSPAPLAKTAGTSGDIRTLRLPLGGLFKIREADYCAPVELRNEEETFDGAREYPLAVHSVAHSRNSELSMVKKIKTLRKRPRETS